MLHVTLFFYFDSLNTLYRYFVNTFTTLYEQNVLDSICLQGMYQPNYGNYCMKQLFTVQF